MADGSQAGCHLLGHREADTAEHRNSSKGRRELELRTQFQGKKRKLPQGLSGGVNRSACLLSLPVFSKPQMLGKSRLGVRGGPSPSSLSLRR